jgi:glycosyltransferase involved in cell wall biosynthesis
MPLFTIVIATRDRAELFAAALDSVAAQDFTDTEIVVVNDGSRPETLPVYAQVLAKASERLGERLRAFQLVRRPKGHGSSYSLNYGVEQARGDHVCFLDDDDLWIDPVHLTRAAAILRSAQAMGEAADVYMANQEAWRGSERLTDSIWLEALQGRLQASGRRPDAAGAYRVNVRDLMRVEGFCHLNALIVRREFFNQVGGLDEGIRWENDRELYLRLLDAARHLLHHPATIARHHVPDPQAGTSITTGLNLIERRLWQLRVLDKCALGLTNPLLRAHSRLHKVYALKRVTEELARQQAWHTATYYAAQALGARPSLKWAVYTAYCGLRSLARRGTEP